MQENRKLEGKEKRSAEIRANAYDAEKRILSLAFASETEVARWYGTEVLSCDPANVDLSRLKNGGPLLVDHQNELESQIGVVVTASCDPDKVARATCKLSQREEVMAIAQDIADGIIRNVSVGYETTRIVQDEKMQDGSRRITWAWMPYEISLVGIPADTSVGIGRSAGGMEKQEKQKMSENKEGANPAAIEKQEVNVETVRSEAAKKAREDAAEITKLARMHKCEDLADKALTEDWTLEKFRGELLRKLGEKSAKSPVAGAANIGMTDKEVRSFSLLNVIKALSGDKRVDIGFEREVSDEAAKKQSRTPQGFIIPHDVLVKRDLQIGGGGTGSNVVATNLLAGSFIDALRNRLIQGMGMMSGLVGDIAIPKNTGVATAYWVTEGNAPTESQQTLGQITGTPHTVGAFTDISRKLIKQSSIDVEAFVRDDLTKVLAIAINSAAINGTGSAGQPSGLLGASGINNPSISSAGSATYAEILGFLADIETDNALVGDMHWEVTPEVFANLAARPKGTGDGFILDADAMRMIGYNVALSNQLPANTAILGVWSQLMIALWGGLDVMVDPYTASNTGTVRIVALQDVDVMLRHAQAFAYNSAVTT